MIDRNSGLFQLLEGGVPRTLCLVEPVTASAQGESHMAAPLTACPSAHSAGGRVGCCPARLQPGCQRRGWRGRPEDPPGRAPQLPARPWRRWASDQWGGEGATGWAYILGQPWGSSRTPGAPPLLHKVTACHLCDTRGSRLVLGVSSCSVLPTAAQVWLSLTTGGRALCWGDELLLCLSGEALGLCPASPCSEHGVERRSGLEARSRCGLCWPPSLCPALALPVLQCHLWQEKKVYLWN